MMESWKVRSLIQSCDWPDAKPGHMVIMICRTHQTMVDHRPKLVQVSSPHRTREARRTIREPDAKWVVDLVHSII